MLVIAIPFFQTSVHSQGHLSSGSTPQKKSESRECLQDALLPQGYSVLGARTSVGQDERIQGVCEEAEESTEQGRPAEGRQVG